MRTRSRRQDGWALAAALAFIAGVPAVSHAQQSGLFPLAPIKRQRTPCIMEDPVYRMYRQQFYGYHPTCWRKFPPGWGCPSPEAPNPAASFAVIPRDKPPADVNTEGQPEAAPGAMPDEPLPSPGAGSGTPARPPANPNNLPPLPPGDRSPFDLDTKPTTPPAGGATPPATPPGGLGVKDEAPAVEPAAPVNVPASSTAPSASTSAPASNPGGDLPVLALPDPTTPVPATFGVANPQPTAYNAPAQAPRRAGLLGNLFGGNSRR